MAVVLVGKTRKHLRVILKGVLVGSLYAVEGIRILVARVSIHRGILDIESAVASQSKFAPSRCLDDAQYLCHTKRQ